MTLVEFWMIAMSVTIVALLIAVIALIHTVSNQVGAISALNEAQEATTTSINFINQGLGDVATFMENQPR